MSQNNPIHTLPLKPLHLPQEPGLWPLPWGYWGTAALIIALCVLAVIAIRMMRKRSRSKRAALSLIQNNSEYLDAAQAQELVRQAALSYFPREDIAGLTQASWLAFLDSQLARPRFSPKLTQWQKTLYTPEPTNKEINTALIEDCKYWLENALPPKRKYREWNQS